MSSKSLEDLQNNWKETYQKTLPAAARSKSDAQKTWPVTLDHCFARIILDAVVGIDTPWNSKIKSPAYKNMSIEQLVESIALGKQILDGAVDLMELDERSLAVRGKSKGGLKRKERDGDGDEPSTPQKRKTEKTPPSTPLKPSLSPPKSSPARSPSNPKIPLGPYQDLTPYLKKIALSHTLTPFRKKVLTVLCQVPPGKYTTYGALSKYLSSSPRAVGNALKNNPFAPNVPCHRVLASGGGIGGFKGSWGRKGEEGVNDVEKRELLRAEGVKFDGLGRVCGGVWDSFS